MSNWSQRLSKVQAHVASPQELEPISHLGLEELKIMPMDFGKAHAGKTFQEIWDTNPSWIKWFLAHYASSQKTEHRRMIRFIHLKIEESEAETPQPAAKSLPRALGARPKSTAAPSQTTETPGETEFEMMYEAPWANPAETKEDINALQARMLNLETAMQRMLIMMQNAMPLTSPVPTNIPESAAAEWDDPWNN